MNAGKQTNLIKAVFPVSLDESTQVYSSNILCIYLMEIKSTEILLNHIPQLTERKKIY